MFSSGALLTRLLHKAAIHFAACCMAMLVSMIYCRLENQWLLILSCHLLCGCHLQLAALRSLRAKTRHITACRYLLMTSLGRLLLWPVRYPFLLLELWLVFHTMPEPPLTAPDFS